MSLWVKKAKVEQQRKAQWVETLNRVYPLPFEERRSRVGMVTYRNWRMARFIPFIVPPFMMGGMILESREVPHEHLFTAFHVWCADVGFFRHDTIKALNPAYDHERMAFDTKNNDRKFRLSGADSISEREMREFAAINIDAARVRDGGNTYGL
jgi:hypothetical protein